MRLGVINDGDLGAHEVSKRFYGTVATEAALTSIPLDKLVDTMFVGVAAEGSLWILDLASSATPVAGSVVTTIDGTGRFHAAVAEPRASTGVKYATKPVGFADLVALGAVLSGSIDFDAALPAGAMVLGYGVNVTAIFDNVGDTASGTFDLGISAGDTDVWVDGGSLDAVAKVSTPTGTGASLVGAVTPAIAFAFDVNFDTLTKGALVAYIAYTEPF